MDQGAIIDQLEELAERFGIQIRYEPIKQDEDLVKVVEGLCLLRGEYVLIIDSKATMRDKIRTLAEALRHFYLDQIYIKPALRELLEKVPAFYVMSRPSLERKIYETDHRFIRCVLPVYVSVCLSDSHLFPRKPPALEVYFSPHGGCTDAKGNRSNTLRTSIFAE